MINHAFQLKAFALHRALLSFVIFSCLLLVGSCATIHPPLPADVSMNKEAGRGHGGWIIAMVRVNDSQPLPFIVDTGCPVTCLDQSLEPKLGKRLADANFLNFGVLHQGGAYRPPKFYLGDTPLQKSGALVVTLDCKALTEPAHFPVMGFLGMDVLKHYCIQLNFQSGQIRFMDAEPADKKNWGQPFHLTDIGDGCMAIDENLTGAKGPRSIVDTGCDHDGLLVSKLFQQWTNHTTAPARGEVRFPKGRLGGEIYRDLELSELAPSNRDSHTRFNVIGLHVLSQNLVTFDFPKRTMYLKHATDWPLAIPATADKMRNAQP